MDERALSPHKGWTPESAEEELLMAGARKHHMSPPQKHDMSPPQRRSLLLDAIHDPNGSEDEESTPHSSAPTFSPDSDSSKSGSVTPESRYVLELSTLNADRFFLDESSLVKAVLFTKKPHTPSLWGQVAENQRRSASFGVIRHTDVELLSRFQLTEAQLPKVIVFAPGRKVTFTGIVDFSNLTEFIASISASAGGQAPRTSEDEWLAVDLGPNTSDLDDALIPRFVFRKQDGAQIIQETGGVPACLKGYTWARREGMLTKLESGRMFDICQALQLQNIQNRRSPFSDKVTKSVSKVADVFSATISGGTIKQAPGLKEAEALLADGRLAFPREDGSYLEALLQWNINGLTHLRASALMAGGSEKLIDAFDSSIGELQGQLVTLPLPTAAQAVLDQASGPDPINPEGAEGLEKSEALSAVQGARMKEVVQAALLLHALCEINEGVSGGYRTCSGSGLELRIWHLINYSKLLVLDALQRSPAFGPAGIRAANIISDPDCQPRLMMRHSDPPLDLALLAALSPQDKDRPSGSNKANLEVYGEQYQIAVFNCYILRRIHMHAEPSRHAALLATLSALLRLVRQLAAESLPASFTAPSPFAPLLYAS